MDKTLYETIAHRGYNINIYYDPNPESPRTAWDNLGTFYTSHRNYCPEKEFSKHFERDEVFESEGVFCKSFLQEYIALPIYLYDHSGITISSGPFGCRWDSGLFGMVAVSIDKVKNEFGWKKITAKRRRQIESYLQGEIDTYDHYCTGEVYGFQITPDDDDSDIVDSCWGYFGDDSLEQIRAECRRIIDGMIEKQQKGTRIQIANGLYMYVKQLLLPFPELEPAINI